MTHTQDLMNVLNFTPEDLAANQHGELGEHQRYHTKSTPITFEVIWIWFVVGFLLVAMNLIVNDKRVVFLSLIGVIMFIGWKSRGRSTQILMVEGRINLNIKNQMFWLRCENKRFQVSKTVFFTFKNYDPYRIYYFQDYLLSAEWLNESPFEDSTI